MPGRTKDVTSQDADMHDVPTSAQDEVNQDAEMREDAEAGEGEEEEEEEVEPQRVRIVWPGTHIMRSKGILMR